MNATWYAVAMWQLLAGRQSRRLRLRVVVHYRRWARPRNGDLAPAGSVGKKNWLFTGSERAGKRAAAIRSLHLHTNLNGLDPAAELSETLEKLPTCPNCQIDSLLPRRNQALHP